MILLVNMHVDLLKLAKTNKYLFVLSSKLFEIYNVLVFVLFALIIYNKMKYTYNKIIIHTPIKRRMVV